MAQVHAPYHFVPLSKWNYLPDWAHLVSHDVPFKDGLSGTIEYTLVNDTPLCVGQHIDRQDGKPAEVKWARDPNGRLLIAGSSLKGMLRNVLEIASFGKFAAVDDKHFSYRDISNSKTDYAKFINEASTTQAGWIRYNREAQQWELRHCEHTILFHDEFNQFNDAYDTDLINKSHGQSAQEKYAQCYPLSGEAVSFDIEAKRMEGTKGKEVSIARACRFGQGKHTGVPVFSSFRPGKKKYTSTRLNFSYMFYDMQDESKPVTHLDTLVEKLFNNHPSALVEYFQQQPHPEYGIPVFAIIDKQGRYHSLGFAKMPRILYDNSIHQLRQAQQPLSDTQYGFDLAELMFGTLRDNGLSLKSRVYFADATAAPTHTPLSRPVILSSPKASYVGSYLEQPKRDANFEVHTNEQSEGLAKYKHKDKLKGWKRYPVQAGFNDALPAKLADKTKQQSCLEMAPRGTQFKGHLVFHNLRPEELGALLWALQLGEGEGSTRYCHSLGHGRPLGAGAVRFEQLSIDLRYGQASSAHDLMGYSALFEQLMHAQYPLPSGWRQSAQIRHLLSFADIENNRDKALRYMPLEKTDNPEEEMSYSDSMSGNVKQVLPDWHDGEDLLAREETLPPTVSLEKPIMAQVLTGRLVNLFHGTEATSAIDKKLYLKATAAQAEAQQSSDEPDYVRRFEQMQASLEAVKGKSDSVSLDIRRAQNAEFEALLTELTESVQDKPVATQLLAMANQHDYCAYLALKSNSKNRPKLDARKRKVAALKERYGL
ncbi:TIGR03986 family type III CRISPR-associated RAMP protein [Pseudoalteromonas rubra]|uniref:TIGR03986 family type III CRISPR-associated RAMP protein n=1 Tax=Pseudoalteromonas rubra TaxID=43658 RepID=UPI000F7A4981|nr:TIGR03986 family CRISPR-associated RAMP protein [Pseudoalteromonas rubra]